MKRLLPFLLFLAVVVTVAWLFWQQRPAGEAMPEGLILANGRLEGDRYTLASRYPGRVSGLLAREGDQVRKGEVLVRLDDEPTRAKLKQAQARLKTAEARLAAARTELETLRKRVPLQIDTAKADVAHARAALEAARARAHQARKDARRYASLTSSGAVDRYRADQAALEQATKRLAEAELGEEGIRARERQVQALDAERMAAEAAVEEARSMLEELEVKAPADGMITTRIVDTGEVISPGGPLMTIVDLDRLYLKVYVPEKQIGRLRLGLEARIYTDAFPDQPFAARVRYIASRAQFTPKEVQTPDERVKLVYAVKLYLEENPEHRLTPGLPADAVIRWREDVPWTPPRW